MMNAQNFFYSNLCHTCKKLSSNLKHCISCKTVAYCSREHQVADWSGHKEICKVICKVNQTANFSEIRTKEDFQKMKIKQSVIWQTELGRILKPYESQMWMFPKVCAVCYSNSNIKSCDKCLNEFYCCEDHQIQHFDFHDKYCSVLKLAMLTDIHYFKGGKENPISFKELRSDFTLSEDKTSFMDEVCYRNLSWRDDVQFIVDTDQLISGATMLLAMEKSGLTCNRNLKTDNLKLHFVGASTFELCLNWFCILELLFHYITNLSRITIILIGQELNDDENVDFMQFKMALCKKCQEKVNKMVFMAYKGLYHETIKLLEKPDMVIAFNSGLHEFEGDTTNDSWKKSIQSLVNISEVPLLLTAYTEDEIIEDIKRIRHYQENVEVIYGPKENPYKNQRPFRNWSDPDVPVFYNNAFMAVLAKNQERSGND